MTTLFPGSTIRDATELSSRRRKNADVKVERGRARPQEATCFDSTFRNFSPSPERRPITLYHSVLLETQNSSPSDGVDWKDRSLRYPLWRESPFNDETDYEMRYFCSQCTRVGIQFRNKDNLRAHLRRRHNIIGLNDRTQSFYCFSTKVPITHRGQRSLKPRVDSGFQTFNALRERDFDYGSQKFRESPELPSDGDLEDEEQGDKNSIWSPLTSSDHECDDLHDSPRANSQAASPVALDPEQGREVQRASSSAGTDAEPDYEDESMFSQQSNTDLYNLVGTLSIPQSIRRRFLAHFLFEFCRVNRTVTAHAAVDGENLSNQTPAVSTRASSHTANHPSKRKHANTSGNSDGGDEENEGDRPGPARVPRTESSQGESSLLLACPYYKRKPLEYVECQQKTLRTICRVKQHIWRSHCIPVHCSSCNMTFKTESERDAHQRQRPPCDVKLPVAWDGITKEQEKTLHKRSDSRKSTQMQWNDIFEILFPGSPLPSSPYLDPLKSHQLVKLQAFMGHEWPPIFERLVAEYIPAELRAQQNVLQPFMNSLFQNAISIVLQRFEGVTGVADMASLPDSGYQDKQQTDKVPVDESQPVEGNVGDSLLGMGSGRELEAADVATPDDVLDPPLLFRVDDWDEYLRGLDTSEVRSLL